MSRMHTQLHAINLRIDLIVATLCALVSQLPEAARVSLDAAVRQQTGCIAERLMLNASMDEAADEMLARDAALILNALAPLSGKVGFALPA